MRNEVLALRHLLGSVAGHRHPAARTLRRFGGRVTRRLAYADPPYPGQAKSRYNGTEVDHAQLVARLDTYDGWALSTSASALLDVWKLAPHARCAAWVKTFASNGWSRVRWSWEPVLFVTDRRGIKPGERSEVWDSLVSAPDAGGTGPWQEVAGKGGGAKPYEFVRWVLTLLDYRDEDTLDDLFPGSGAVARHAAVERLELFDVAAHIDGQGFGPGGVTAPGDDSDADLPRKGAPRPIGHTHIDGPGCDHQWGEQKPHPMITGATIRYCQRCGTDSIRADHNDGSK